MKPLKAAATTSQPVLSLTQIETIFFKVPELYEVHREFYDGLLPRVQQWSHHQRVGDLFQKLVRTLQGAGFLTAVGSGGGGASLRVCLVGLLTRLQRKTGRSAATLLLHVNVGMK